MTDINPIVATKVAQGSQPLAGASTGVTANFAGGGNFWDMIFSSLLTGDTKKTNTDATAVTGTTNPIITTDASVKTESNPLALLQIALSNQTIDENGNIVLPDAANDGTDGLQSRLDLTNDVINHLKNVLPENAQKEGIFAQLISKLQTRSDNLQASLSALEAGTLSMDTPVEDIPMPLLISLGLSPSEIAQVSDNIKALEEKLGRDITVEDLIAGVGNLIPQTPVATTLAADESIKISAPAADGSDTLPAINDTTEPTDDLAARLNALDVGAGDEEGLTVTKPAVKSAAEQRVDIEIEGTEEIGGKVTHADAKKAAMNFKENLVAANPAQAAKQAVTGSGGEILVPATMFSADSDVTMWQQMGVSASPTLNLGPAAQAATMTASNTQAGQPHPATQLVAATMTKAGKEGVADTMTLRLDPPELGSVNIRLEFGKDKSVKAHLTVDKPETYMMLQRDGLMLERALQSAGLDANGNSISFELAQGGADYNPDNNGQGGGEKNLGGSASKDNGDDADLISSTMTWAVDSATGHVRYNILA